MKIYFCADDYGLCEECSGKIAECVKDGAINKVSSFVNFSGCEASFGKDTAMSLHMNLVEGKCVSGKIHGGLIADENGRFRHTFGGLFCKSITCGKKFEDEVYEEVKAQIAVWKKAISGDGQMLVDSHQHTHMIPGVFRAVMRAVRDEGVVLKYLRIPAEPITPFLKTPSLYFTYSPVNLIKQWLLKILWAVNKKNAEDVFTAYFFGILFSGNMDEKRVKKILPHYIKLAEKKNKDIEVLFHPGYVQSGENLGEDVNFSKFYLSDGRKTEYETVMKI